MGENDRFKLSFTTTPAWDLQALIDVAHRYGYDGIDLEVEKDHKHGLELGATESALQQARETLQQEGLAVSAVATSLTFSDPDQAKRDAAVERGKQYVEFAQQLAAPHLEIFGGTLPAGIEPAAAIDYMAEALDDVVDHAAEAGVHVLLRTSGDFANTRYVREVCKQLYSEHFGVAWDVDPPLRILETLEESYDNISQHIRHVHIRDMAYSDDRTQAEACSLGAGFIRFDRALEFLCNDHFEGHLSVVLDGSDPKETLSQYAESLRNLITQVTGEPAPEEAILEDGE